MSELGSYFRWHTTCLEVSLYTHAYKILHFHLNKKPLCQPTASRCLLMWAVVRFSFSLHYAAGFWFLLPLTESDFKCLLAFCSSPRKLAVTELSEYFIDTAETCGISVFERGSVIFRYMQRKMHRTFNSLENLLKASPGVWFDIQSKKKLKLISFKAVSFPFPSSLTLKPIIPAYPRGFRQVTDTPVHPPTPHTSTPLSPSLFVRCLAPSWSGWAPCTVRHH